MQATLIYRSSSAGRVRQRSRVMDACRWTMYSDEILWPPPRGSLVPGAERRRPH